VEKKSFKGDHLILSERVYVYIERKKVVVKKKIAKKPLEKYSKSVNLVDKN
jgi:hypothetical protein